MSHKCVCTLHARERGKDEVIRRALRLTRKMTLRDKNGMLRIFIVVYARARCTFILSLTAIAIFLSLSALSATPLTARSTAITNILHNSTSNCLLPFKCDGLLDTFFSSYVHLEAIIAAATCSACDFANVAAIFN